MAPTSSTQTRRGLDWLISELGSHEGILDEATIRPLLVESDLTPMAVAPYVRHSSISYARSCVVRRENYELLVLTWQPAQGSVAHDHSGSLCGLKVVQGRLTEQLFEQGPDGQVRRTTAAHLSVGGITVDPGVVIHSLGNSSPSGEVLITVHIYSPPLPEVRRYAVTEKPPASVFLRPPPPQARVIAIVGGGFTGTMALANVLRFANQTAEALHVVMIDRQPAFGEGVAYRTNDARHLLNVPASRMSAWPDRPDDFLDFARAQNETIKPGDFLPRKIYGQYIRQRLLELAESAGEHLSVEVLRDEATKMAPTAESEWMIETAGARQVRADIAVLALGHRPPDDPFARRWIGPRTRFVADPWAALVLSQIGPNEPVLLLGSGLTAIDAILTLDRPDRTAPIYVVSRRGLLPLPHTRQPNSPADVSKLVADWLDPAKPLTVRRMVSSLRRHIIENQQSGFDWRANIDALRPSIHLLWERLNLRERSRFLTHVRPIWEVHRHRMAPDVAESIDRLKQRRILELTAGSLLAASADSDGIDVLLSRRGNQTPRNLRVSWVVNCTGPGVQNRHSTHPILRSLLNAGVLCDDELSLGLCTDPVGRAVDSDGKTLETLLVAGTLRKSTLWESTAVPELRHQAQTVARIALERIAQK